jgi:hypothetical protein
MRWLVHPLPPLSPIPSKLCAADLASGADKVEEGSTIPALRSLLATLRYCGYPQ